MSDNTVTILIKEALKGPHINSPRQSEANASDVGDKEEDNK